MLTLTLARGLKAFPISNPFTLKMRLDPFGYSLVSPVIDPLFPESHQNSISKTISAPTSNIPPLLNMTTQPQASGKNRSCVPFMSQADDTLKAL